MVYDWHPRKLTGETMNSNTWVKVYLKNKKAAIEIHSPNITFQSWFNHKQSNPIYVSWKIYIVILMRFSISQENSDWSWLQAFVANTVITTTFTFAGQFKFSASLRKEISVPWILFMTRWSIWEDAKHTNRALPTLVLLIIIVPQSYGPEINYLTATLPF